MAIKNYTTEVSEEKTVGEIMGLLAAKGARSVQINYDEQSRPSGVSFIIFVDAIPIPFKLPCNFEGVLRTMAREYRDVHAKRRFENNPASMEQARRIAWRIIKDWTAAQMAIIEAEQASMIQVFLPYAKLGNKEGSRTVFDQFMEQVSKQKALPQGEVDE